VEAVLGSGISTCLFDAQNRIGGMNHFELPGSENEATARFANIALANLLKMMQRAGARSEALKAQIFGGALNPQGPDRDVGQENYNVVRDWLAIEGIPLVALDIGGHEGRKVRFNSSTNECDVIRTAEIPGDRWYPYTGA
jgi:chemotaxis protein CheD